jgi:hypothetical protein
MRGENKKIFVQGSEIAIFAVKEQDFISLTDMVRDIEWPCFNREMVKKQKYY